MIPTGLAGFFLTAGRYGWCGVPARLDVMGGIADYSGSNVCEAVLGRGMLVALQLRGPRSDAADSDDAGWGSRASQFAGGDADPAGLFFIGGRDRGIRAGAGVVPERIRWRRGAAYIGGSIFTLIKEEAVTAAVWVQFVVVERGADECGDREFGGGGDRDVVVFECVFAVAAGCGADCAIGADGRKPCRGRAVRDHGSDRDHQRRGGAVDAYFVPAGVGGGGGDDSGGDGVCGDQFDGAAFGGGERVWGCAGGCVYGEEDHRCGAGEERARAVGVFDGAYAAGVAGAVWGGVAGDDGGVGVFGEIPDA